MKIGDYLDKRLKQKPKDKEKSATAVGRLAKHLKVDESKLGEMLKDAMDELSEDSG